MDGEESGVIGQSPVCEVSRKVCNYHNHTVRHVISATRECMLARAASIPLSFVAERSQTERRTATRGR